MPSDMAIAAPNRTTDQRSRRAVRGRADVLCLLALCFISLISWLPKARGPIDIRWDGGTYYILGTSLAEGRGYLMLNEPGSMRADQYPPLLPALVAIHQKILGTSNVVPVGIWMRRTWIVLSLTYVISTFLLARLVLTRVYAFWLSLVCLMSYDMFYLSTLLFAELPFALATTLFAYFYLRRNGSSWTRYMAPAMAIAAYLLRSLGIALLAAWIADALFRGQFRRAAIRAAVALIPILAWQGYVHSVEKSPEYQHPAYAYQRNPSMFYNVSYAVNMKLKDPFRPDEGNCTPGDYIYRIVHNAIAIPSTLGQSVTAREGFYKGHVKSINRALKREIVPNWPYKVLLNFLGCLVLVGVVRLMMARQWLLAMTILLTIAAVCTTPWPGQFARYIAPILPLLLLALLSALQAVPQVRLERISPAARKGLYHLRLAIIVFTLVECSLALQSGYRNFLNEASYTDASGKIRSYRLLHYTNAYPAAEKALDWLKGRANPNAVIASSMPQWVYLQSGFKSVMPPLTEKSAEAETLSDSVPVSYFLMEQLLMDDNFLVSFPALVARSPETWKLVYGGTRDQVRVYARVGVAELSGSLVSR